MSAKGIVDIRIDQIMPELFSGWLTIPFEDVIEKEPGEYVELQQEETKLDGKFPVVDQGSEFINGYVDNEDLLFKGDLPVIIFGDHTRRIKFVDFSFAVGASGVKILKPKEWADSKFFYYYLNSLNIVSAGYSRHYKFLKTVFVPIPSLSEQRRIVAKLDALMERIERNKQRLEKIPALLKRFRQSVLAAAVSGKLTEDWREKNGVNDGWDEVELSKVIPKGGIFDGPFGSNLKTADYTDKGVRVIRLENIEHLFFVNEKETYITSAKYQTLLRHTVGEGDIIFSSFIADEIRACMLPHLLTKAVAKADCFCIRPDEKLIEKKFLLYSLVSTHSYGQLVSNIHGATRPRINTTQLKALLIPFPKLEEQKEIVRRVEQLFAFTDKIEARYTIAKARLDKLPQSILAKAFRGELVPQNPDDEPAIVLIERIKQQKKDFKRITSKSNNKLERYKKKYPDVLSFLKHAKREVTQTEILSNVKLSISNYLIDINSLLQTGKVRSVVKNSIIYYEIIL